MCKWNTRWTGVPTKKKLTWLEAGIETSAAVQGANNNKKQSTVGGEPGRIPSHPHQIRACLRLKCLGGKCRRSALVGYRTGALSVLGERRLRLSNSINAECLRGVQIRIDGIK